MKIKWEIEKKRGNLRPLLHYTITLEAFETALAPPPVTITSHLPKVPAESQRHCLPGQNERKEDWKPEALHPLTTPFFKDGTRSETLRLPWRETPDYPEVEASFLALREKFEDELKRAYDSAPISIQKELGITAETRHHVVSGVAAERFLRVVGAAPAS